MSWSDWRPLGDGWNPSERSLQETLDGGQAFRWQRLDHKAGVWQGIFGPHLCQLKRNSHGALLIRGHNWKSTEFCAAREYFGASLDWNERTDCLPCKSDPHLQTCMDSFPQLRLLQQPLDETLLAFMCSAMKRIPQIKIMCENLAAALGKPIALGHHSLPNWEQVSQADETALRNLGLGFRAKNIKRTADLLAASPNLLQEVEAASYPEAKSILMELPGVGEKIADCTLLFGASKLEAFPVDTWVLKVMQRRYGLHDWNNSQLAQFGRIHYGKYAGFAQQFMFAWERGHAAF